MDKSQPYVSYQGMYRTTYICHTVSDQYRVDGFAICNVGSCDRPVIVSAVL
jgi:hypothetical protein